jgi:hypothetical protein
VLSVTGRKPHNLRRSRRILLASMGCPEEIGEAVLGHLPTKIAGTYNAYTHDKERRLWLGKLSKQLESLAMTQTGAARLTLSRQRTTS